MAGVSLVKGGGRRENVRRSLELIAGDITEAIGARQVVIKPNFVSASKQLASSHVDQMRGILDFFSGFYRGKIIIAEASSGDTLEAYRNFGYLALPEEYDVELSDLNWGAFETVLLEDSEGRPLRVRAARELLDGAGFYRVSAAKLKTHDVVVVTLSVINMAMGCVARPDKALVHQGIRRTNLNIACLALRAWPDLAVIDGFTGMEGNGPTHGDPVNAGIALSGTDALAADRVACETMGVDFFKVGYLSHCAEAGLGASDMKGIEVIGAPLGECVTPFKLHSNVKRQYEWK